MAFTASGQNPSVTTAPSPTQPLPEYFPFTTNLSGIVMFPFLSLSHTPALSPYVFPNPVPDINLIHHLWALLMLAAGVGGGRVAEGEGATTDKRGSLDAHRFVAGHLHSATAALLFATKKEGKHGIVAAAMATQYGKDCTHIGLVDGIDAFDYQRSLDL
jgi:hypothetical protein